MYESLMQVLYICPIYSLLIGSLMNVKHIINSCKRRYRGISSLSFRNERGKSSSTKLVCSYRCSYVCKKHIHIVASCSYSNHKSFYMYPMAQNYIHFKILREKIEVVLYLLGPLTVLWVFLNKYCRYYGICYHKKLLVWLGQMMALYIKNNMWPGMRK